MTLYDVTLPVREGMPTFPGDRPFRTRRLAHWSAGDPFCLTGLTMTSHTGTHVDPPAHMLEGAPTLDGIPPETLVGPCRVVEISPGREWIEPADLPAESESVRVLFRTRNSARWADGAGFSPDYVGLGQPAAEELARRRVKVVGVDGLSVERGTGTEFPVHRVLARAGVVVIEGLDLSGVRPGAYELLCLPMRLADGDGAPARVFLRGP